MAEFRFEVDVLAYNTYGDRVISTTPASILAKDKNELTAKVRASFNASYDDFRNFWSHGYRLNSVSEVATPASAEIREGN